VPTPLPLSDEEMTLLLSLAQPIEPAQSAYAVAAAIGPGIIIQQTGPAPSAKPCNRAQSRDIARVVRQRLATFRSSWRATICDKAWRGSDAVQEQA
jgi:hypothetical protein